MRSILDKTFKGHSASAFFSSTDPSGCMITGGSVFVSEGLGLPTGPGSSSADADRLLPFDSCLNQGLLSASSIAPAWPGI